MTNILLNISNFDEDWASDTLRQIIHADMKVLILPLSYNEGWINDAVQWKHYYGKGRRYYEELVRPFRNYGIPDRQIRWVNYFEDDHESAARKIREADILFFTGGYPDWMMQRLYDLDLEDTIRGYDGIVMGTSAGALIQLEEYHLAPDADYDFQYQEGLGLVSGFDMDVHYQEDENHIASIIRSLEDKGRPVLVCPNQGGALIEGEHVELMGGAFFAGMEDLEELYQLYEGLR
jgi:peptidase E